MPDKYVDFNKEKQHSRAENVLGKNLPFSNDAEKSVLAAILLNDENITLVSDFLKSSDFYSKQHQAIYQAVLELAQENKRIDLVVLQDYLDQKKQLAVSGGVVYLMELQEDIPAMGLILQHAKIVNLPLMSFN